MNFRISLCRLLLSSLLLFQPLKSQYVLYPFSLSWQEAEKLQNQLIAKYGVQKPFCDYLATVYTLLILQEQLHSKWLYQKDDPLKNLIVYTQALIEQLEAASHSFLSASTDNATKDPQPPPNDPSAAFLAVLEACQKFLDQYAPQHLAPQGQRENTDANNQQDQPTPPYYPWPPTYPWPQPQQQQPSQPPTPQWVHAAKIVGAIAAVGFVLSVLKEHFQTEVHKKLDSFSEEMDRREAILDTCETIVSNYKVKIGSIETDIRTANKAVDETKKALDKMKSSIDAGIKKEITDAMSTKDTLLGEQLKKINELEKILTQYKKDNEAYEKRIKEAHEAISKTTKEAQEAIERQKADGRLGKRVGKLAETVEKLKK